MIRPRMFLAVATGLVAGVFLAGCGDGDDGAATDPATDSSQPDAGDPEGQDDGASAEATDDASSTLAAGAVCTLLTPATIDRATGESAEEGRVDETVSSEQQVVCQFDLAGGGFVQIVYQFEGDAQRQRASAESFGEVATEDVDEFPDGYYVAELGTLGAQAGSDYVQVAYFASDGTATRDQVVALMEEILAAR